MRGLQNKILQKYEHPPSPHVATLLSEHSLSDSNFRDLLLYPRADPHDTANLAQRDTRRSERCGPPAGAAPASDRARLAEGRRGGAANPVAAAVHARRVGEAPCRLFVALLRDQRWKVITQEDEDQARRLLREHRDGPAATQRAPARRAGGGPVRRCALCAASRAGAAPGRVAGGAVPGGEARRSDVDPRALGPGAGRAGAVAAAQGRTR